jgi:hypothetical protein
VSDLQTWLDEAVRSRTSLSLVFDDGEFVSMRDEEHDRDVLVLFADVSTAREKATGPWGGTTVVELDLASILAWVDGLAPDVRVVLTVPGGDAAYLGAPSLATSVRAGLHEVARLPPLDFGAPGDDGRSAGMESNEDRYSAFVHAAAKTGEVWGLWDERAWASFGEDDARRIPWWSSRALASACASGAWSAAEPRSVPTSEFLRYLGHLETDDGVAALMLTPEDDYIEMRSRQVACELMRARAGT